MKKGFTSVFGSFKGFTPFALLLAFFFYTPNCLFAQTGLASQGLWQEIKDADVKAESATRLIIPNTYRVFKLDFNAMKSTLLSAPAESNLASYANGIELYFPLADGTFGRFKVWNSPIMAPELAAKYPEIKTYAGYNMDNPGTIIRLDVTPAGFHAMTYGGGASVFIDPYAKGNTQDYLCYFKHDFAKKEGDRMTCNVDGSLVVDLKDEKGNQEFAGDCGIRHEYRLALACSGEYGTFHGGTVAQALAAMVVTMNRVNGVFERDCAVRMIIIGNNDQIVYVNPATDPYSNPLDDGITIEENQTNIDAVIGNANYDIGHVFTNSGSGLAQTPAACIGGKARATTGSANPIGDPFDIDYVAHEMGHQFSAKHTQYNDACNRNNSTAVEPGSASTIMGYAGVCLPFVQNNSDAYFSTASVIEIRNYVSTGSGSNCDVAVPVPNTAPTVTALSNYSIPISTPFVLTASATDPDGSLTYCWEQVDAYTAPTQPMPPTAGNLHGPVFRSLTPVASPSRYFPNITAIFNNSTPTWEVLPSIGRAMNFRVTVRDNVATAGCTSEASNTVTTVAAAGPFVVTSPNTAVSYAVGSTQTVTWNVANTTAAPVSCANVDILFTSDGGATFTTLLANTPNDGSQAVTMPNTPTKTARIVVKCSDNIFFDVSNVNFKLAGPIVINEVDYDQPAGDAAEFIELKNISGAAVNLNGWSVELINGNGGGAALYQTINLPNVNLPAGGYFVICANNANTPNCDLDVLPNTDLIQNGAPDAIGLKNAGVLVDAVSYEGNTGAPYTEGSGVNLIDGAGAANQGISRFPDGVDTDVNNVDLLSNVCISPGLPNLNTNANCVLPCDITGITFSNISGCNDNGSPGNPADDYFTANISVAFVNSPAGGTLNLTGDVLAGGGSLSAAAPFASPVVFTGIRLKADGTASMVTATFSADPACSFTVNDGPNVASCSNAACDLTDAGLTDVHCENNNETFGDPSDDYIWFQLNPAGTDLGSGYDVTVSSGSVLWNGNAAADNVPYGNSEFFRLQAGSAGGGNVTITITDDDDPNCTISVLIVDPGSCSVEPCVIENAVVSNVFCEDDDETPNNQNDDDIRFTLNVTGTGVGTGYNLSVDMGTVVYSGFAPANNVPYNNSSDFRIIDKAGMGNRIITITDNEDPLCTYEVEIVDPGSCSVPVCDIDITNVAVTHETCPGDNNGTVTITATCTTCNALEYSLDGTNWQPGNAFSNLAPGNYTARVRDTADPSCAAQENFSVNPGDGVPPVFDQDPLPGDLTLDCNDPVPTAATLTATDAVSGPVPVTFTPSETPGTCPQEKTITRTWTAEDACGNAVVHTQTITIVDNDPPVLNGLPAASVSVECDQPLPALPTVTASDLCDTNVPVTFSTNTTPGACPQEMTITRTWSATDDCGNNTSFTQTITVTDNTPPVFNQNPLPQDITVSCSDIPDPETLDGTDNCDPGIPIPVIFINEIHYDNTGGDVNEFIEIAGTAGTDLSNYQIVLYNGTGGAPYNTLVLSGVIDNEAGGFGAVSFAYPVNGIQNGAPDGIALATTAGVVVQFLSYEGAFVAVGGVANGMMSTDIGVLEVGTEPVGLSLQLTGTGQEYGDFTWVGPLAASAGTLNAGQIINPLPGVIPAMFSQMISSGDCNGESTITRMWQLKDACGNAITHTQVLTVTDTEGPSFSPPPLPMDITISCDQPVPAAPTLTAADLCDVPGMLNERVWINEIHYDNTGGDVGEFIEIAGTAGTDLATYNLVLYNGADGLSYNTLVLNGVIPNQANGFGTLCFNYPVNGIQNGAPDGVALVHNVMGGMVVQFLSYEGVMTANNGPANGMMSTDIGVSENGTNPVGTSLYLTGNGDEYADFTWAGPLAASNCGVNTGQTFIGMSMGPVVTFEESQEPGACPQERFIYRTWTATDDCGNETVLNQTITITDDVPPTVNCPANLTLNLDIYGNASLSLSDINFTYSDNCAPQNQLVVLPFPTQNFDCDDEGTTQQVTISVQDPCGNVGMCTINVTIAPFSRCTPVVLITDPCVCKNNATSLTNGQFGETIKIESLAGKTWTVIANTGLYQANSPAPPSAPVLIPVGTILQENPVPSGDYYLTGLHVDAQGYSITFRSERGEILTIGNLCEYPNPSITSDLSGPFCLFSDPVTLTGTPGDANIISQGFTINGVPATVFDPGQGVGQYQIVYTVNGGTPKAFGPNDPGCIQSVKLIVNVLPTPSNLTCNNLVTVALDDATCAQELLPDMALEGTYNCFDDYIVELDETVPLGNGPWLPPFLDAGDIGKTYQFRVTHLVSGNKCWGSVKVEDKLAPVLVCQNFSVPCNTPSLTPDYLFSNLGILAATPAATDCQSFTLTYIDSEVAANCASGLTKIITRKWTAKDASGNTSTCEQTIGLIRPTLGDVTTPPDYDGIDEPGFACTSSYPTPEWIEGQGLQGFPHVFGQPNGCHINWEYHDFPIEVCDGTYKLRREWTIVDWCIGDGFIFNQIIKVEDKAGPAMTCPANLTVSVNPFQCCANVDLPNIVIEDECSRINNIGGMVTTFDAETNQQTGMFLIGGTLTDFPGNNHWDPDTLAAFGTTTCLPVGVQTVTYMAEDDCGNTTSCTFRLTIRDYTPPVASCDQTTTVAIGTDDPLDCYGPAGPNGQPAALDACSFGGVTWVKASTFNDGSYDQCNNLKLTIRRMAPYSDCIEGLNANRGTLPCDAQAQSFPTERDRAITEQDSIKFYCCEVGTTQTIVLAAYQVDLNGNIMTGPDGSPIKNECMIQVEVQDKIKPSCVPPANVSVDCESFDPSLWTYGKAQVADNCCLDTTKEYQGQCGLTHTVNYSLFDTICNKGTITRTFRAFDCYGQSSQCTQRVFVTYNQDYFLRFPNDVIVTACNDSARYDEPKFFGEDCELLGFSSEDEIFTVVPDACFKIERTWTIINWCTYNPNGNCIEVPNPNPVPSLNHSNNLPGPTVSACGTLPPWKSTVIKINPTDPVATDYCTFWQKDANCYKYKQIIKVVDTQDPVVDHCPQDTTFCDVTGNDHGLWNSMDWWDNQLQSHDLCEGPVDLTITAKDLCSGPNVSAHFLLFLDLDNDGTMETVINSINPPPPGVVYFGNANTPNFGGGVIRQFDNRGLPLNQNYQFSLLQRFNTTGTKKMFSVRWNTQQFPNVYTPVEFPYGTHKIKWFITDGCGNETVCEYNFTVRDCKAPTVVCLNGLSANIMPTGMIQLWASDFLQYTEDNCTPPGQLKIAIRKCGEGTGIPTNPDGTLQTSVAFTCAELGTQCVELWSVDASGNADYCETYVIVQDNLGGCSTDFINVAGELHTEMSEGVEEAMVKIEGTSSFTPPFSYFDLSDVNGHYEVMNNIPLDATFTIAPEKTDNPLNGVTTYDLVLISQHILGMQPLDSPYKMIAADANKSGSITTFDIVELRKLILGIYTELPNNDSWRFVDNAFVFPNPQNPFESTFPESISVANAFSNMMQEHFMGVKVGDVNNSAIANATAQAEERSQGTALFDLNDRLVVAGETFEVSFNAAKALTGFQFTLLHEGLVLEGVVETEKVTAQNFGKFGGKTTVSVDGAQGFILRFRAEKAGKLSDLLQVSGEITRAEAYVPSETSAKGYQKAEPALRFDGKTVVGLDFELYQNQPNPFVNKTMIGFFLPEGAEATLSVMDESGRLVYRQKGVFPAGENTVVLDRALLNTSGVLYYKLETDKASATRKMIQAK